MNHSPAPWKVETGSPDGFVVCSLGNSGEDGQDYFVTMNGYAMREGIGEPDAKNDARLIAAAPELLIACRGALTTLLLYEHVDKQQAIDFLREVIAKAEGKAVAE